MSDIVYGGGKIGPSTYEVYAQLEVDSGRVPLAVADWLEQNVKGPPPWNFDGERPDWDEDIVFAPRDVVAFGGSLWFALRVNGGVQPGTDATAWVQLLPGIDMALYDNLIAEASAVRDQAALSEASAGVARLAAQDAAQLSEAAAQTALLGTIYADKATGEAATANGQQFVAYGPEGSYATRYRMVADVGVEQDSYPNRSALDAVADGMIRVEQSQSPDRPTHSLENGSGMAVADFYARGVALPSINVGAPPNPDEPFEEGVSGFYNDSGFRPFAVDMFGWDLPGGGRMESGPKGVKIIQRDGSIALGDVDAPIAPIDISPIFGGDLALVSDRRLALHVGSLLKVRRDDGLLVVTVSNRNGAYTRSACDGTIELDPARLGGQTDMVIRQKGQAAGIARIVTARVKAVPVSGSPTLTGLFIGDSITNRQTAQKCNALLTSWGYVPTWIGTINGAGTADGNDATGPLGEGREGWAFSDFLGTKQDADWSSIVAPGEELAYLALNKANKRLANPFLNPDTGAGSAAPIVTVSGTNYRFDLGHYLSRFSLATPGLFVLNVGMNDMLEEDDATGLAQVTNGYGYLVNEIRRVAPTAKILIWATTMPRGSAGDLYWPRWAAILAAMEQFVRARAAGGDANIRLCSAWAHQSQEAGWLQTLGAVDAATGFAPYELTEPVHPLYGGRDQHSEPLAAAIANFF
ncbi:SGNH/GDSL hydrolase family protein [Sphingobium sp. AS12]|uniref:SGNH/GDSL hydrolase family protein n=1 Tax=Sphingobium sp. AS12 TaxID=2849495 RepID=UPI001C31A7AD|nr:SGNH/GDSL hydrolase family protein [Sphingobium sp. AS12]MBV2147876.1 SGNH/GDSL hydrolase family protein [Sphingobium sp. AS12]